MDAVLSPFARLLPYAGELGARRRRAAAGAAAILLLLLAVHLAYTALGIGAGSELVDTVVNRRCQQVVMAATQFGAGVAQGYHIARPMPAADLGAWLAAGGFVLGGRAALRVDDEDVEGAGPVDALHAVQLDVGRR